MSSTEKGTFWLFVSNIVFFLSSFLLYFFLGRYLLSAEQFGVFAVVISLVSVITTTLMLGLQQTVSRFVASSPQSAFVTRQKLLFWQFLIGIIMAGVYFAIADLIGILLNDLSIVPLLRLSALLVLFHPLLGIINGVLHGLKKFSKQAFFSIFYSSLKLCAMLLLVVIGFAVEGAIIGFVIASIIGVAIGFFITRMPAKPAEIDLKKIFYFALPVISVVLMLNFLQNIDLFAVKALSTADADLLAGNYSIAATIARIPASLLLAVTAVALPLVSGTISRNENEKTGFYIKESMRYSLLFLGFCTAIFAAAPNALVELVFSSKYALAFSPLFLLAFAYLFFGLFQLLSTIITAAGKPQYSLVLVIFAFAVSFALNELLVPLLSLEGAAIASIIAMLLGFVLSAVYVIMRFKVLIPAKSVLRIAVASAIVFFALAALNISGFLLVPAYIGMLLLYAAILALLRELKRRDLNVFLNMVK